MLDVPRYKPVRLIPFILLSCLLHSTFLLLLPDLTRLFNIHIKRLLPLSQIEIEVALIKPEIEVKPKPNELHPKPSETRKDVPSLLIDDHIASLIDAHMRDFSALGETSLRSPAAVVLPPVAALDKISEPALPPPLTEPNVPSQELLGRLGHKSLGHLSGKRLGGILDAGTRNPTVDLDELLSVDARESLLKIDKAVREVPDRDYGLSGPVAVNRQVLFRPGLPKVALARDVSVSFRFWVRPDGSVSRVETRRIGDLELVNVAERYLKQWRFSSLPSGGKQKEQWGTVKILFQVPR